MVAWLLAWDLATPVAHAGPEDFRHTVALRYRRAALPSGILDMFFFDSDDPGAQPYARPKIRANLVGLEYTLAMRPDGGASFVLWGERIGLPIEAGYWDDIETPIDHDDGDWLAPQEGLGLWTVGVSFAQDIALSNTTAPVWVGLGVGGGLGLGVGTGSILVWHPGFHPDTVEKGCGEVDVAPLRAESCTSDGEVQLPGVVPIVDITIGPVLHIAEHAMVRIDLGIHDLLYYGIAGGGTF